MKIRYLFSALSLSLIATPALAENSILYAPAPEWAEETDVRAVVEANPDSNNFFVVFDKQTKFEKGQQHYFVELAMRAQSTEFLAEIGKIVRAYWQPHANRGKSVPITIVSAEGEKTLSVNQSKPATGKDGAQSLGTFKFTAGEEGSVTFSTEGASGNVHLDAVQVVPVK